MLGLRVRAAMTPAAHIFANLSAGTGKRCGAVNLRK
jgi:hypothetical protein